MIHSTARSSYTQVLECGGVRQWIPGGPPARCSCGVRAPKYAVRLVHPRSASITLPLNATVAICRCGLATVGQVGRSLDGSMRYFVPVLRRAQTARTSG